MPGLVLNGLPNAEIGQVIVIALTAEGIAAAFHTAVIADRRSTITALRHGRLATRHPDVVISEFNLTVHYFHLRARCFKSVPGVEPILLCRSRLSKSSRPAESNSDSVRQSLKDLRHALRQ
jgi:hypothetical protein